MKKHFIFGFLIGIILIAAIGAASYKTIVGISLSTTNNTVPRWDGLGGTRIKSSGVIINDTNGMNGISDLDVSGIISAVTITSLVLNVDEVFGDASGLSNIPADKLVGIVDVTNLPPIITNSSPNTTLNDMIRRGDSGFDVRIGVGKIGDVLYYDGSTISWKNKFYYWEAGSEFLSNLNEAGVFLTGGGQGGSGASTGYPGEPTSHYGLIQLSTGNTTTNGYAYLITRSDAIIGGENEFWCTFWIKTPATNPDDSSQPYKLLVGFIDQSTSSDNVDGMYLLATPETGAWQFVTQSNSVMSTNVSTIAFTSSEWIYGEIRQPAGGTNVILNFQNSQYLTNTTTIPIGPPRYFGAGIFVIETGGSGATTNTQIRPLVDSFFMGGSR